MAKVCDTMGQKICTVIFVLFWIHFLVGTSLLHASLVNLEPACADLPDNLIKGFGEVFKFDYLATDADDIQSSSANAVAKCNIGGVPIVASAYCPTAPSPDAALSPPTASQTPDTSTEKTAMQATFANSLSVIKTVANDIYFGTEPMQDAASQLNEITTQVESIDTSAECYIAVPIFCTIWVQSDLLVDGVADVTREIDKFENSDAIKAYEENADKINYMHVLPWVYIIGLAIYTIFWKLGGVCCCCRGGSCIKNCLLFPHLLFCHLFFVIITVFVAIGVYWNHVAYPEMKLDMLNGGPTIETVCVHIQEKFPDFWKTVFLDLEEALSEFFTASCVCCAAVIAMTVYELVVCCSRIYAPTALPKELASDDKPTPPQEREQAKEAASAVEGNRIYESGDQMQHEMEI